MRISMVPSLDPADYEFTHSIRVRFAETDAMSIVHHSNYLLYMEETRVAYLRHVGHPYSEVRASDGDTAVLEVFVQHRKPLLFDEVVDVHVTIGHVRAATFQVAYLMTVAGGPGRDGPGRGDPGRGDPGREVRATAVSAHGAIDAAGRPSRLPAWMRDLGG